MQDIKAFRDDFLLIPLIRGVFRDPTKWRIVIKNDTPKCFKGIPVCTNIPSYVKRRALTDIDILFYINDIAFEKKNLLQGYKKIVYEEADVNTKESQLNELINTAAITIMKQLFTQALTTIYGKLYPKKLYIDVLGGKPKNEVYWGVIIPPNYLLISARFARSKIWLSGLSYSLPFNASSIINAFLEFSRTRKLGASFYNTYPTYTKHIEILNIPPNEESIKNLAISLTYAEHSGWDIDTYWEVFNYLRESLEDFLRYGVEN
ncbi:NEQ518 [Nanoarchaeum equitans Kin4-M]|uniref:NEQ518 n=1 Tax=Nanoarchaeum equitans (strain Kin4-M) TaxID=228908 RepID=Q74MX0_NANEQ|nr:NEQ518 [Nanoarchaeum equitans Kin4-M]